MVTTNIKFNVFLVITFINQCSGDVEKKVIKGDYAKIRHHPHAVYLEIMQEDGQTHICGSSVLNQLFLVTVAHCFYGYNRGWKTVAFAGHENIRKSKLTRSGRSPIIHKKFFPSELTNDIALLLLNERLPLGDHVKRIILKRSSPKSITGTLAGWGIINVSLKQACDVMEIKHYFYDLPISFTFHKHMYVEKQFSIKDITQEESLMLKSVKQTVRKKECSLLGAGPGTLCAGNLHASESRPAQGDSGSGLVDSNYELIGLLSYKINLFPALPVYTNASYFYRWINTQIKRNCKYYPNMS